MIKRIIAVFMVAAAFFATASCNKAEVSMTSGEQVTVNYAVSIPVTKTLGQGEAVNKVWYAIYRPDGTMVKNYAPVEFTGGKAHCPVTMMRDQSYKVIFVAQHYEGDVPAYAVDAVNARLTMPRTAVANSDNYDLFTFTDDVIDYQGGSVDAVTLTRKVAQLNFSCNDEDWANVTSLNMVPTHSSVTLSTVPATCNLLTNVSSAETVAVTYNKAQIPGEKQLATIFCFVGEGDSFTTETSLSLYTSADESSTPIRTLTVNSVPLKANYKTNVTGSIMTDTIDYAISLDTSADGTNQEHINN